MTGLYLLPWDKPRQRELGEASVKKPRLFFFSFLFFKYAVNETVNSCKVFGEHFDLNFENAKFT